MLKKTKNNQHFSSIALHHPKVAGLADFYSGYVFTSSWPETLEKHWPGLANFSGGHFWPLPGISRSAPLAIVYQLLWAIGDTKPCFSEGHYPAAPQPRTRVSSGVGVDFPRSTLPWLPMDTGFFRAFLHYRLRTDLSLSFPT